MVSPFVIGDSATMNADVYSSTVLMQNSAHSSLYYLSLDGISLGGELLNIDVGTFDIQDDDFCHSLSANRWLCIGTRPLF